MTGEPNWFLQPISVPLLKEQPEPASLQAAADAVSLVDLHLEELGRRGPPLLVPEEAHHSPLRVMPSAPPISTRTNPTKSTAKNVIEAPAAAA